MVTVSVGALGSAGVVRIEVVDAGLHCHAGSAMGQVAYGSEAKVVVSVAVRGQVRCHGVRHAYPTTAVKQRAERTEKNAWATEPSRIGQKKSDEPRLMRGGKNPSTGTAESGGWAGRARRATGGRASRRGASQHQVAKKKPKKKTLVCAQQVDVQAHMRSMATIVRPSCCKVPCAQREQRGRKREGSDRDDRGKAGGGGGVGFTDLCNLA